MKKKEEKDKVVYVFIQQLDLLDFILSSISVAASRLVG